MRASLDGAAAATLVALSLCWGLNQVAVKVVNNGLQPVFQAGLRSLAGGLIVFGWCRLRGIQLFERDGTLPAGLAIGFLFAVEFALIYVGIDYTSVSRGIVFLYAMPFFLAAGAHFLIPGERLTRLRIAGLVAAFAGVVLVFSDRLSLPSPEALYGDMLCLGAAAAWAGTNLVAKGTRLARAVPEKVLLYQLSVSAVMLLAAAPFIGPLLRTVDGLVAAAFVYQTVVVVAASYLVWFSLLRRYPATLLSSFLFLTPLFAVGFGALLLGEPLSPQLLAALFLVAVGITLVNWTKAA